MGWGAVDERFEWEIRFLKGRCGEVFSGIRIRDVCVAGDGGGGGALPCDSERGV